MKPELCGSRALKHILHFLSPNRSPAPGAEELNFSTATNARVVMTRQHAKWQSDRAWITFNRPLAKDERGSLHTGQWHSRTVMNLFLIICWAINTFLTRECLARIKGCSCLWRVHELIRPSCLWFALRIHPCCTCRNICPHCARPYSATVATAQWWTIFPLRDRPAKNWFCSNALKWYRNGARCVSSTSTRPKSSPKTKFCGILNPFGSTLRYEVMKCAVYWVSIGHGIGNGWYLVVLSQFEAVRGGIKKLFLFTFSQKTETPPPPFFDHLSFFW